MKLARAAELGREIVDGFELRAVETFPIHRVFVGRALWLLIHLPRVLLRVVSLGLIKGSTITEAKALRHGVTVEIERDGEIPLGLHVGAFHLAALFAVMWTQIALTMLGRNVAIVTWLTLLFELHMFAIIPALMWRRHSWSWVIHPAVTILTARDRIMAEGTARMFREHPEHDAVAVLGRAHLPGYTRELVELHGFREEKP